MGIYLREFTGNEQEISIPHEAKCVNIFIIQIEYTAQRNTALKPLYTG